MHHKYFDGRDHYLPQLCGASAEFSLALKPEIMGVAGLAKVEIGKNFEKKKTQSSKG